MGVPVQRGLRPGIELGFFEGRPLVYGGTEPVAIDAQAGKGKLTRFLGVNLVSPRTAHLTKIITDPFNDFKLYHKAPLALLRGELIDPGLDIIEHGLEEKPA